MRAAFIQLLFIAFSASVLIFPLCLAKQDGVGITQGVTKIFYRSFSAILVRLALAGRQAGQPPIHFI